MNHPTPEDWMTHLYNETPPDRRAQLDQHLKQCPACAARLSNWRDSVSALDSWKLPSARPAPRAASSLRWAAAAAVVLALGFAGGWLSGTHAPAPAAMQKEFDTRLAAAREELRAAAAADTQRLLEGFAQSIEDKRVNDATSFVAALRRQAANLARLRRDLDTVAVVADGRLTDTQEQLYQLASASHPGDPPRPGAE